MYSRIDLALMTIVGEPGALPPQVDGLSDDDLANLSFLPAVHGLSGIGYWLLVANDPPYQPDRQVLGPPEALTLDDDGKRVLSTRTVRAKTAEEMEPLRAQRRAAVMAKRDEVIDAGFSFNGVIFQTSATDRENISGAAQMAFMALLAGGKLPGDLRWHDGADDFGWIALDNGVVPMDAPTVIEFAKAVAGFKSACIFYARYLKDQIDTAANPAAIDIDTGWPS
jgi:hypothetical protein